MLAPEGAQPVFAVTVLNCSGPVFTEGALLKCSNAVLNSRLPHVRPVFTAFLRLVLCRTKETHTHTTNVNTFKS